MKTEKPLLRGHFHQAMFFTAIGACLLLIFKSETRLEYVATSVYSLGALLMFGISALYHRVHWSPNKRAFMRRLDHSAIYIMIAGSFTPICLLALPEESGRKLLLIIWIVALVGILQSVFFVNLPKILSSLLYLIMGYLIFPYLGELAPGIGKTNMILLITGGLVYSFGAMSYGLKRPVLNPRVFSYHEVFHIMVGIGAVLHFIMIYSLI